MSCTKPITEKRLSAVHLIGMTALLCITPLLVVVYLEVPLAPYLEFPPRTRYVIHASFSWPVFLLLSFLIAGVCTPFLYRFFTYRAEPARRATNRHPFPWWGWLGFVLMLGSWILAWNRFSFFQPLQRYTFFPLWFGYILTVNGLIYRRRAACLLLSRPYFFLTLFPASVLFWWYFEYLNRFVQNWYYLGGGDISATEYVIHASICFSTVLPAVVSTHEFLGTFPRLVHAFIAWRPFSFSFAKKYGGWLFIGMAGVSIGGLAVFPDYLFPLVWISPLLVIVGLQLVTNRPTFFDAMQKGNWNRIILPALAALVCGFFWEMWNFKSLAHWEYSVPFVHRFQIFAMPLLGYAGYLPFGLECLAVVSLLNEQFFNNEGLFKIHHEV